LFEDRFFGSNQLSIDAYRAMTDSVAEALTTRLGTGAYSGLTPADLTSLLSAPVAPREPRPYDAAMEQLQLIMGHSIGLWHPHVAAHLHTPVLNAALAAEMAISALNQSMDSFDQAPAATVIEQQMVDWLCRLAGLPQTASGSFTSGGTQSNYTGLLLARDQYAEQRRNWCVRTHGLPPEANRLRILCSELAHFSVEKSAIQLGLGVNAVVKVPVDQEFRMSAHGLRRAVVDLLRSGLEPFAVVATAGTTDFGSIDPLVDVAAIAQEHGLWLHVDAAYGGALLLSDRHRGKLAGIERADSVTIDFHKAFFQPISCGAFLVADREHFKYIRVNADYLNPENHEDDGIPDLVTNSLMTTRRFDALKLWFCLQVLGVDGFARLVEQIIESAGKTAGRVAQTDSLDLLHHPSFGCIVFRYRPANLDANKINAAIPRQLFTAGKAVIGQTLVSGQTYLKLTLSNPCTNQSELNELIDMIVQFGHSLETSLLEVAA
jgi:L-2,4-diaminobutyrate decarboxylase